MDGGGSRPQKKKFVKLNGFAYFKLWYHIF